MSDGGAVASGRFADGVDLSEEQKAAFTVAVNAARSGWGSPGAFVKGQHVCIMGGPGTGKTHTLRTIMDHFMRSGIVVRVASLMASPLTNFDPAFCPATLHSLFGINITTGMQTKSRKPSVAAALKAMKVLVIDEVSTIPPPIFDEIVGILQKDARHINLILVGDFMQLPPVETEEERRRRPPGSPRYAFQCMSWAQLRPVTFMLRTNFRQQSDTSRMTAAIQEMFYRADEADTPPAPWCINLFNSRCIPIPEEVRRTAVHAFPYRREVEAFNEARMRAISYTPVTFRASVVGGADAADRAAFLRALPVPETVVLKKGARVMLVANLDVGAGLVNGACGTVVRFQTAEGDDVPSPPPVTGVLVAFDNVTLPGEEEIVVVQTHTWTREATSPARPTVTAHQIPLTLAYAMTVHKLQGMTITCPLVLNPHTFECGQLLVGLTRVRRLGDLYLTQPLRADRILTDPAARMFMRNATRSTPGPPPKRPRTHMPDTAHQ